MKLWYLLKETWFYLRRHRTYFLVPVMVLLILVALVAFYVGPGAVVTFLYAGF